MSSFSEMLKGFMWGIGFSIAALGATTAYVMNIFADAEITFRDNMNSIYEERTRDLTRVLEPEILKSEAKGSEITIFSKYKNFKTATAATLGIKIKFTIFNANEPAPIAICFQPITLEESSADHVYSITSCKTFEHDLSKFKITTSITR